MTPDAVAPSRRSEACPRSWTGAPCATCIAGGVAVPRSTSACSRCSARCAAGRPGSPRPCAFVLSFAFTYTIQRVFSFGSDAPHGRTLLRYTLLVVFNTIATAAIVGLIDLTPAGWAVGKVVATVVTTIWNYFVYRYWVFASAAAQGDVA